MKVIFKLSAVFALAALIAACGKAETGGSANKVGASESASPMPGNRDNFAMIVRGGQLFSENCAQCHGDLAQGHARWQQPDASGKFPAPPLDGSGHAWHHPTKALVRTIKYGTQTMGGSMPAWKDRLSDEDISAIIQWFQSRWPDEIYRNWQARDEQAQASNN